MNDVVMEERSILWCQLPVGAVKAKQLPMHPTGVRQLPEAFWEKGMPSSAEAQHCPPPALNDGTACGSVIFY